ncbi:MAG TPA: lysylphosphatidylglycerol synthase transmembrane domain-containing protein [Chloroflexia bacterium]|nr:lysylphosphatidylglycerol synthase transmembrane domain-containing protein [Chloroflexia bacterium]
MFKSLRKQLLGLVITLVFLVIILLNLKFDEVGKAFGQANYLYLIPAITITFADYLIRAWRWQFILAPTKPVSYKTSYSVMMIGFMANNLLPARIGEFVRAYTLGRKANISKSLSFATIVLERVCDGLTLVAFMGLALTFFPSPHQNGWTEFIELFSTAVFLGAILFLIFLIVREKQALKIVSFCMRPLPDSLEHKVHMLLTSFVLGLHALKSSRSVLAIVGTSALIWGMEGSSYYLMLRAFKLDTLMSPMQLVGAGLLLLVFVNLGTMVPSAPGFFGVYQAAATVALGAYAVSSATAFSLALLTNTFQYVLVTAIGLFFFSRMQMSFKSLQADKQAGDAEEDEELEEAAAALGLEEDEPGHRNHYAAADS